MTPGSGRRLVALLAVLVAAVACSSNGGKVTRPAGTSSQPAPVATDRPGGTLRIAGTTMPSGDPGWADDDASRELTRMVSRQLYDYPSDPSPAVSTKPTPDLASGPPVVTEGGLVWTVRLRSSAQWDVPGGRRVTATDVARGIKRLCMPPSPSPMLGYFVATVKGFATFCATVAQTPASSIPGLIENSLVPGVTVVGDDTIVFTLLQPAADFTEVLALPAASPVPLEELTQKPNSSAYLAHLISDGPYHFTAAAPGETYRLSRNAVWSGPSDPIRPALADHISIRTGLSADAVQHAIAAGQADMELDTVVPSAQVDALTRDPQGRLSTDGPAVLWTLVVGLHGPASAALKVASVRRALPYCVDKAAVAGALGGSTVAQATGQFLTSTMTGYEPQDPYPTFGDVGDPATCRLALAGAGAATPSSLTLLVPATPAGTAVGRVLTAAFARAAVTLSVTTAPAASYSRVAVSPSHQSWDIALTTITPEWYGNAGRTVFQPLLDPAWAGPRPADGGFRNAALSARLNSALAETDPTTSAKDWAGLDLAVAQDVLAVPLALVSKARFHSTNLQGFDFVPSLGNADPTAVSIGLS